MVFYIMKICITIMTFLTKQLNKWNCYLINKINLFKKIKISNILKKLLRMVKRLMLKMILLIDG